MAKEKDYAKVERLYHVMVELLNEPKVIEVMRKMPAQVKKGEVLDFNGRSFGGTDKPDGYIFGGEKEFKRVNETQAVTFALKRDYTKALKDWLDGEAPKEDSATTDKDGKDDAKKPKKKKKTSKTDDDSAEQTMEPEAFDLVGEVESLLSDGKLKKSRKLVRDNADHVNIKKAKKIIKKYEKASE